MSNENNIPLYIIAFGVSLVSIISSLKYIKQCKSICCSCTTYNDSNEQTSDPNNNAISSFQRLRNMLSPRPIEDDIDLSSIQIPQSVQHEIQRRLSSTSNGSNKSVKSIHNQTLPNLPESPEDLNPHNPQ